MNWPSLIMQPESHNSPLTSKVLHGQDIITRNQYRPSSQGKSMWLPSQDAKLNYGLRLTQHCYQSPYKKPVILINTHHWLDYIIVTSCDITNAFADADGSVEEAWHQPQHTGWKLGCPDTRPGEELPQRQGGAAHRPPHTQQRGCQSSCSRWHDCTTLCRAGG